jgi:3-(3-hydroxy-phenyl)propionate hydroxylase
MASSKLDKQRVIIVGAGPVGLVCALSLAQRDIPVLVLEANPGLFKDLRAGSFHPPTLEVLEPLGVTAKLHDIGIVVPCWQLRDRTAGVVAVFELALLLADETPTCWRRCRMQRFASPIASPRCRKSATA